MRARSEGGSQTVMNYFRIPRSLIITNQNFGESNCKLREAFLSPTLCENFRGYEYIPLG